MGPSGGDNGGYVIATGSPKDINENKNQVYLNFWDKPYFNEMILFKTGKFLKLVLGIKYVNVTINALKIILLMD